MASGRRLVTVGLAFAAVALASVGAAPAPAVQVPHVVSSLNYTFVPPTVTIRQGEHLTYTNVDIALHNVTALAAGRDGAPLFSSATIDAGKSTDVNGVAALAPGVYDFTCTLHTFMTGSLTVTD